MATKRMFSRDIVESDQFLDMSISARCLYFYLGLQADVKGFVTPKKVMRMTGTSDDDLRLLAIKGFIIPFKSGVIVITHWNVQNLIREDREAPTQYAEELKKINKTTEGIYQLRENSGSSPGELPPSIGKVSIDKISIGKVNKEKIYKKEKYQPNFKFTLPVIEGWKNQFPYLSLKDMKREVDSAKDYLTSTGKPCEDEEAYMRNWLRRENKKLEERYVNTGTKSPKQAGTAYDTSWQKSF